MDLGLNEEQEMLKTMARDFLVKECPKTLVSQLEEDEKGYSPELWRKMAELGWMGLVLPEQYGGTGSQFLDLCILLEETGRNIVPGPFFSTVVLCASAILEGGTEEQKKQFLPRIANGDMIMAFALTEPSATYEASGVATRAVASGNDYIINGTKLFVTDAHIADHMIVVARTREGARVKPENAMTLFLVDARSRGIKCTLLKTIAADKQCEVILSDVRVPQKNMLGQVNKGWPIVEKVLEKATVGKCAEMVGGAQQVLDMTVSYAKERIQFGRPIGSFQAIQHYCASMVTDVDGSRFTTYQAAWRVSQGLPAAREVAIAKAKVNDAYHRVTVLGHQIHGAIGFTKDHDMGLYYKRAKAAEVAFGDADYHREKVAQALGL